MKVKGKGSSNQGSVSVSGRRQQSWDHSIWETARDFPGYPVAPKARGWGSIPDQRTRSHMAQLRVSMLQLKILHAATKTQCNQINI